MLANFKNSFENSSLKTKIELYLLPILLLFLCYVLFYNEKIEENQNTQNSELLNIENKKFTDSILELSNKIEDIAKSENLIIQKTQSSKEQFKKIWKWDLFNRCKSWCIKILFKK